MYVGLSKMLSARLNSHRKHLLENTHLNYRLQNAWNATNGIGFEFRILIYLEEPLLEAEAQVADELILNGYTLLNIAPPGQNLPVMDTETRQKISETMKGRKRSPESVSKGANTQRGRVMSEDQKEKLRKVLSGRKLSPSHIANIRAGLVGRSRTPEQLENITLAIRKSWTGRQSPLKGIEKVPRVTLQCLQCGCNFIVKKSAATGRKKFCSRVCKYDSFRKI